MKLISLILLLFISVEQLARGDLNIYGPHGENLGPNPDMEQVFPDLRQKKELDALQEQNSQLQQQILFLQDQLNQLGDQLHQMQTGWQNEWGMQIQIPGNYNYGYPYLGFLPFGNFGPTRKFGHVRDFGPARKFGHIRDFGPARNLGHVRNFGPARNFGNIGNFGGGTVGGGFGKGGHHMEGGRHVGHGRR